MSVQRRGDARRREAEELGRALMPYVDEYRRWAGALASYRRTHGDAGGKAMLPLVNGERKAAAQLLRAVAELDRRGGGN